MTNKIILFDIDYTLFNTDAYKENVFKALGKFFPQTHNFSEIASDAYAEVRKEQWFEIKRFTRELLKLIPQDVEEVSLENVWKDQQLFTASLYPETVATLEQLAKIDGISLGIFSSGAIDFQQAKIVALTRFFENKHIHIYNLKDENIEELLREYRDKQIILVDDYMPVIEKAKTLSPSIITIWVKRGRFAAKVENPEKSIADYTIDDLTFLPEIVAKI